MSLRLAHSHLAARCSAIACILLASTAIAAAREPAAKKTSTATKWVRVDRSDDGKPLALQTSVVRYAPRGDANQGVTVDLIGAVHVGDRRYYDELNRRFTKYDALLYELVAPEGTKVERGAGTSNRHPVGALQNGMKDLLELEHQLELVDYSKKNFVHADMTPEQFSKSMSDRGEGFLQMLFRLMGQSMAMQSKQQAEGKTTDLDLLAALFSKNRAMALKRIMAGQFEDMESLLVGFGGPDGSTIITERNKVALEKLSDQIKAGKKRIGIFYGAGHLADMDKRLREQFKMTPAEPQWITAWDLRDK